MNQHITQKSVDATLKTLQSLASSEDEVEEIASAIAAAIDSHSPEASFMALMKITSDVAQHRLKGVGQKAATLCMMSIAVELSIEARITEEEFACVQALV